jgi:hypothetical protein
MAARHHGIETQRSVGAPAGVHEGIGRRLPSGLQCSVQAKERKRGMGLRATGGAPMGSRDQLPAAVSMRRSGMNHMSATAT